MSDVQRMKNHEAFKHYALTYDNILKMIGIYYRLKTGIPLILMGETGVGTIVSFFLSSFILCIIKLQFAM